MNPAPSGSCNPLFRQFLVLSVLLFLPLFSSQSLAYDNKLVHPYIAEQGFYLLPTDLRNLILTYLGNFRGENNCVTAITSRSSITEGASDEDKYDPKTGTCFSFLTDIGYPDLSFYNHHFYDVDNDGKGLDGSEGALTRATWYFGKAIDLYESKPNESFWYLGRIAHLLADMSVPAHVLLDKHTPFKTYVSYDLNPDSYEKYTESNHSLTYASAQDLMRIFPVPTTFKLNNIFYCLAQQAQFFPSDNKDGNTTIASHMCDGVIQFPLPKTDSFVLQVDGSDVYFNDADLKTIRDYLMPRAFQYTAALYLLFWHETHQAVHPVITQNVTDNILPKTLITQSGTGFTGSSTVTLHFRKSDSSAYVTKQVPTTPDGAFSTSFIIPYSMEPGEYEWWAVDDYIPSKSSNVITYTIALCTGPPTVEQNPSSLPRGATISQWGYGFTPNSTVTLHFTNSNGSERATKTKSTNAAGFFENSYTIPSDMDYDSYTWWAEDDVKGTSNHLTYEVTNGHIIITSHTVYYDETWRSGWTYLVQGGVSIAPGASLIVESGATIKMSPGAGLYVNGILQASGAKFTVADGLGRWKGITINNSIVANKIDGCTIEHAETLLLNNSISTIINTTITDLLNGINVIKSDAFFANNSIGSIASDKYSLVVIKSGTITGPTTLLGYSVVDNNTITSQIETGVSTITNNTINGSAKTSDVSLVDHNTINGSLTGGSTVTNNTIKGSISGGPQVVTGNKVSGFDDVGIHVTDSSECKNNTISGGKIGIMVNTENGTTFKRFKDDNTFAELQGPEVAIHGLIDKDIEWVEDVTISDLTIDWGGTLRIRDDTVITLIDYSYSLFNSNIIAFGALMANNVRFMSHKLFDQGYGYTFGGKFLFAQDFDLSSQSMITNSSFPEYANIMIPCSNIIITNNSFNNSRINIGDSGTFQGCIYQGGESNRPTFDHNVFNGTDNFLLLYLGTPIISNNTINNAQILIADFGTAMPEPIIYPSFISNTISGVNGSDVFAVDTDWSPGRSAAGLFQNNIISGGKYGLHFHNNTPGAIMVDNTKTSVVDNIFLGQSDCAIFVERPLTINAPWSIAGDTVKLSNGSTITVYNQLIAKGTRFSWSNGQFNQGGISFLGGDASGSRLDSCVIDYANDYSSTISIWSASPTVTSCFFQDAGTHVYSSGISIIDGSPRIIGNTFAGYVTSLSFDFRSSPMIENNLFKGNTTAIHAESSSVGPIKGNRFIGNQLGIVANLMNDTNIDARYNSWGSPSGPLDDSDDRASGGWYNPTGTGDRVSDRVMYDPWLGKPLTVTLTVQGSGKGTVTSEPAGIAANVSTTSTAFGYGDNLLLTAKADEYHLFSGWSGGCANKSGACAMTLTGNFSVTATFDPDTLHAARLNRPTPVYYATLLEAYTNAANGDTIQAWATTYEEILNLNGNKLVTFKGGYNQGYTAIQGKTTLKGKLTLTNGVTVFDNLEVR